MQNLYVNETDSPQEDCWESRLEAALHGRSGVVIFIALCALGWFRPEIVAAWERFLRWYLFR